MHTFAETPKATGQVTSVRPVTPDDRHRTRSRALARGHATASCRVAHEAGRIPIRPFTDRAVQTKLAISRPDDIHEREADQVAEQVMRMPESVLQHAAGYAGERVTCETLRPGSADEPKHTRPGGRDQVSSQRSVNEALVAPGRPLDSLTRAYMEPRFGHDFSHVRVHMGGGAAELSSQLLGSRAYTVGHDIVFGAGEYAPEANEGRRLLAHELTHVVQQASTVGARGQRTGDGHRPTPAMVPPDDPTRSCHSAAQTCRRGTGPHARADHCRHQLRYPGTGIYP